MLPANSVRSGESLEVQAELEVDGERVDVTSAVSFSVSPVVAGTVIGAAFVAGQEPTVATLFASYEGLSDQVTITVLPQSQSVTVDVPGQDPLPDDIGDRFAPTPTLDPEDSPRLVYPNDGVLLPQNLGQIEIHFKPNGLDLFRIGFIHSRYELFVYTACEALEDGCVFPLDAALYSEIAEATAGFEPIEVQVLGVEQEGDEVGASDRIEVSFSAEPVQGALYYWTTSRKAIMRVDFGAGNEPEQFFPTGGDSTCYGCHALSPNGERMTLSQNGQNDGELFLLEVKNRDVLLDGVQQDQREQFQSWSPDSQRFAAIWADSSPPDTRIRIRDGETGTVEEIIELGHEPSHPNWSPTGDRIAYTRVTYHKTSQRPGRGGISFVEELPGGGWSAPHTLIEPEDGLNYYNPAYALDGSFLLYNRSECNSGVYSSECDADADPSAQIWAMRPDGSGRVRLVAADGPGLEDEGNERLTNSFPRWAPFEGPRSVSGQGRIMWMTFSSRREYGLRSPPGSGQLLWMAAVDPDAVVEGSDGSFPAFALPFQDLSTSNHIGQWTEVFVPVEPDPGGGEPDPQCREVGQSCGEADVCCAGLVCVGAVGMSTCQVDV